ERLIEKEPKLVDASMIGRSRKIEDARGRYIHAAKSTFPEHLRLDGLKVVVDCANGAAYEVAPSALWELGADVTAMGVSPNETNGLALVRTQVGDRYVLEAMREGGFNVGGEQSGHIILSDYATTGDGLVAALQVLACLVEDGLPASEMLHQFDPLPQLLKNVR